jgi:hypothetical protein
VTTPNGEIERAVRRWLASFVVGLGLCPFAAKELDNNRVRFAVTDAQTEERMLLDLNAELALLESQPAIETTLLIHPRVLTDFSDFNQFLDLVDRLLDDSGNEGVFQVASFHPYYRFAGTAEDDAENYTNRSPYPILQILREASLERAIDGYPDVGQIPVRNVELMKRLGHDKLQLLLNGCFDGSKR